MKKALSVLLVAAALFGFYGSAVNLNDILACKDYWEEAGEKSTADMNKLEDGLNQLKDNEQAYLDGKQQVEDGEAALADGEAQYAAGLKSYEEAPAQLAAGERKLAAGEKELADGEDSYKDLKALIAGLKTARAHGVKTTDDHSTYWHDGFSHTVSNDVIQKIAAGEETDDSPGLQQARNVIAATVNQKSGMLDAAAGLGGMESSLANKILSAGSYEAFDEAVTSGIEPLETAATTLEGLATKVTTAVSAKQAEFKKAKDALAVPAAYRPSVAANLKSVSDGVDTVAGLGVPKSTTVDELEAMIPGLPAPYQSAVQNLVDGIRDNDLGNTLEEAQETADAGYALYSDPQGTVAAGINDALKALGGADSLSMVKSLDEDLYNSLTKDLAILTQQVSVDDETFSGTIDQFATDMTTLAGALNAAAKVARSTAATFGDWDDGYQTLAEGQQTLGSTSDGIPFAFKNMVTNPTIKKAIKKYDKSLMKELKKYDDGTLKGEDMDDFDDDLVYICNKVIPRALKVLAKVKANAAKQLADGRKQLADGRKQLAAGRASYAAAPGQLADAERQLAEGRQQLEDGKAQLAQYEDGEQQVRDGLASLFNTEADLDLVSIADRLNGDGDFDNGDNHLELDEGLAAVDVGRGYQADDGVLITEEIMARAVGTGALLGAGAFAVLAAILSFLKKNKGAGVCAILAAAAGAFGAFYGTNAGTYFSDIAGSTAGNAAWVAAGILGAVALVHAIVHFAAGKAA